MSKRGLQSFVLVLALAAPAGACRSPGTSTLHVDNRARHYELFVPADTPAMPLVIVLHGNGSTGRQMERLTRFDEVAAREHVVVAYPDAVDHHWNDGRPELDNGVDDVAFISSLIEELATRHGIDRQRVYVTGISNGAMMSFRLACDLADRLAGVAPVTGLIPAAIRCDPRAPVSLLVINGTADPLVPYNGGMVVRDRGELLSTALSTERFARKAGCNAAPPLVDEPDVDRNDGTRTRRTTYDCPAPVAVELLTIEGGGHTWPGGAQYLPKFLIGPVSRDFNATERIWDFFAADRART